MAKDKQQKRDVAGAKAASTKMRRKEFEKELAKLQVELTYLQTWVQATGARIIVVFEGRDTAGKGGVISRITACTSPRVYRHVALPAPSRMWPSRCDVGPCRHRPTSVLQHRLRYPRQSAPFQTCPAGPLSTARRGRRKHQQPMTGP